MADTNSRGGGRKLAIGVALIAAGAAAGVGLYRSMDDPRSEPGTASAPPIASPDPAPAPSPASGPPLPTPSPVAERGDLLLTARAAASDYAAGAEPSATVSDLANRRFRVRIAFGCEGARTAESGGSAFWSLGPDGDTFRIGVRPEPWTTSAFAQSLGGEGTEAVEGFWIPRPWQDADGCPPRSADPLLAEPAAPSPQTVGLATVFGPDSSRLARRGERPYELFLPLETAAAPGPQGLQLVLEGRVTGFANGRTTACRAASPDQRPVCLIGVEIERVAVRDPARDALLGEWRNAAPVNPSGPARPSSPAAAGAAAPAG